MPSNHLILSSPSPPAFNLSQHQVFSKESVLPIKWPKYWSFSFSMSPSSECSGLISLELTGLNCLLSSSSSVSHSVMSDSFNPTDCIACHHSLLQGIILVQGSNLGLLHGRQILYHLSYRAFTFKSLLQYHSSKASILWHSAFFMVHSHIHT